MILAAAFMAAAMLVLKVKRKGWAPSNSLLYRIDSAAISAVLLIVGVTLAVLAWVRSPPLH